MRLVSGKGINDADYQISPIVNGKQTKCIFYQRWKHMLERCYSSKLHITHPTYKDCTVCNEWLSFMNFRSWMVKQDWEGMQLDKDIMFPDNKIYSPETCRFVTKDINTFFTDSRASRGEYLIGVTLNCDHYRSRITHKGSSIHLGYFGTEIEAHNAWKEHKIMQFNELIDDPVNEYIREGLIRHKDLLKS